MLTQYLLIFIVPFLLVGIILLTFTRMRRELLKEFEDLNNTHIKTGKQPSYKLVLFVVIVCIVVILCWPVFWSSWFLKKRTMLDDVQEVGGKLIIQGYRRIAAQHGCAPTSKTTDQKIVQIYSTVGTAFHQAEEQRGEHIPAPYLNTIVLKFLQVYEMGGDQFMEEHLKYEVEKYLVEGLRPEYKQALHLIAING